jgi:hypothetical protein
MPMLRQRHYALNCEFSCKRHDGSGSGTIYANLNALDAGIEQTWRCAWLVVEAGACAHRPQRSIGFEVACSSDRVGYRLR